jgi:serine/threonine-protein kinase
MSPDRNTAPGTGEGDGDGRDGGPDPRVGTTVDKYTITKLLGRGGMGAVYEARHATILRRFAIKFLLPQLAVNRDILRRFENEAKAAGSLEHPNLAAVTDFGRAPDGAPYLVLEYLQGEDCSKLLRRLGPLPVQRAVDIVVQTCRGLAVAHKAGIVHRDLKPENLFLTEAGDGSDLVKVLDFGIAKLRTSDGSFVTSTGATFGTAHYMSPEQGRGAGDVDQRTDIWSLGVVLYELLSGRKPFEGDQFLHVIHQILSVDPPRLSTLRKGLPSSLVAVVERAMTKDVSRRLPTAVEMAQDLAPFSGRGPTGKGARAAATPTLPTPVTGARSVVDGGGPATARKKGWMAAALAAVVTIAIGAFVLRPTESSQRASGDMTGAATTPQSAAAPSPPPPPTMPVVQPVPVVAPAPPPPPVPTAQPEEPASPTAPSAPTHPAAPVASPKTKKAGHHAAPPPAPATPPAPGPAPAPPHHWVDPFEEESGSGAKEAKTPSPANPPASKPKPKPRLMENL